jgi:multidrug efflux system membrane fusion protein
VIVYLDDQVEDAELKKAEAALALAKVSLNRSQRLVKKSVESQATFDQRLADYNQQMATVASYKARLDQKKIKAPFSGQLGIFFPEINVGHYVQAGENMVSLTDRTTLYVNFTLPEQERPKIKEGQEVLLMVDAYPERTYKGKITSIDPQIKEQTRTISLQASLTNEDLSLFPGMYGRLKIVVGQKKDALLVPETALNYALYGHSVFILEKNKEGQMVARRQSVKVGTKVREFVEILEGLKSGDLIVTIGGLKLDTGMPVAISSESPLPSLRNLIS